MPSDLPGTQRRAGRGSPRVYSSDALARPGTLTGYLHPGYAESLAEFGTPRHLPQSGGWILERRIPGFPDCDGISCYPLLACEDWSRLDADLEGVESELVSLSAVTDPFGYYDSTYLRRCFPDVVLPFKEHFIIDLSRPMSTFVHPHHRRYARHALRNLHIERCQNPMQFVDDWVRLYSTLIGRHRIKGISAFSKGCFAKQLRVPGIIVFRAIHRETTVGMTLWYLHGEVGYYHLGAYNALGYQLHASFALFWFAIEFFAANALRWLNLGAGAGVNAGGGDGLTRFKSGWSTGSRTAYFCGRIFNQERYSAVVKAKGVSVTDYFPAYRKGEFG